MTPSEREKSVPAGEGPHGLKESITHGESLILVCECGLWLGSFAAANHHLRQAWFRNQGAAEGQDYEKLFYKFADGHIAERGVLDFTPYYGQRAMTFTAFTKAMAERDQSHSRPDLEALKRELSHVDHCWKRACDAQCSAESLLRELAEALTYVLEVREIKCQHKHPGPDDACANCRARSVLEEVSKLEGK